MKTVLFCLSLITFIGVAKADGFYTFRSADSWRSNCYAADASGNPIPGSAPVLNNYCNKGFALIWSTTRGVAMCYPVDQFGYMADRMNDTIYDNIYCVNFSLYKTAPNL